MKIKLKNNNVITQKVVDDVLHASLLIGSEVQDISVRVKLDTKVDICADRIDAYVWGLLPLAMFLGEDICSDSPISESLYYNLEYHFIEMLTRNNKEWKRIHIHAPLITDICQCDRQINVTGISCGVDSLYTVATHSDNNIPQSHRINTLAFFNCGASYIPGRSVHTDLNDGRQQMAEEFAKEYGYHFLYIESNLPQIYEKYTSYNHVTNHTYMMLFCSYFLQGSIGHYYYSSGYSYNEFSFNALAENHGDASHYDLFTLDMASIGGLHYHSTGGNVTRFEKIKLITNYKPAQNYLNVCVKSLENCCTCNKCLRTIFSLEALGTMDNFKNVFPNYEEIMKRRIFYITELYYNAKYNNDIMLQEILPYFEKEITVGVKVHCFLANFKRRILK